MPHALRALDVLCQKNNVPINDTDKGRVTALLGDLTRNIGHAQKSLHAAATSAGMKAKADAKLWEKKKSEVSREMWRTLYITCAEEEESQGKRTCKGSLVERILVS